MNLVNKTDYLLSFYHLIIMVQKTLSADFQHDITK